MRALRDLDLRWLILFCVAHSSVAFAAGHLAPPATAISHGRVQARCANFSDSNRASSSVFGAPTVTSFDDGDADNLVPVGSLVTYTITFSEDLNAATVTPADFNNAGTAAFTTGAVMAVADTVTVAVTPMSVGTLIVRIPTGAIISDLNGNNLVVPVQDNDTVVVQTVTDNLFADGFE
jgi:hypothetical protein